MAEEHRHMPDANRLSVLIAVVLLAYALARIVEPQQDAATLGLFGVTLAVPFNLSVAAVLIAAGLTATGVDWLLRGHPRYDGRPTFQHWILPALTALTVGVPIYILPISTGWWLSFVLGGILLLLIFLSEYITLDASDIRYPAASTGLAALSFAMFLILTTTLAYSDTRLILTALTVFIAAGLVALRAIHLRTGKWEFSWTLGIAFIMMQITAALHYWPLNPIQVGLASLGPLYALTGLAINASEEASPRRAGLEAALGLAVFWLVVLFIRL